MIDITTISTFPTAPSIKVLQATNSVLNKENQVLKTVLTALIIGGIVYVVIKLLNKRDESKSKFEHESEGDQKGS